MKKEEYKFINKSETEFKDISSESYRTYVWSKDDYLFIENPMRLHVSESGGHRIAALNGQQYYIKPGWLYVTWEVEEGKAHFSL